MPVLEVRHVGFTFPRGRCVLRDLCANFEAGQVVAIIGPNGAGKSTLLRLLLGAMVPTTGSVLLDGAPADSHTGEALAQRLAFVAQRSQQGASMSSAYRVRELLELGARYATRAARDSAIDEASHKFELKDIIDEREGELSAGEQQRCAVARAWTQLRVSKLPCRALLADEPTSALDPAHALGVLEVLRGCARDMGACVVLVLHDLNLASRFADAALLLTKDGHLQSFGRASEVLVPANLASVFGVDFTELEGPCGPGLVPVLVPGRVITSNA
jgi:iron complex transport system ATP-binding protein